MSLPNYSNKTLALQTLIGKITTCFQSLQREGMKLGSVSKKGNTFWGLLRLIDEHGPITVPQIAIKRKVSRQRIQVMVDEYAHDGYLALNVNPVHKRSKLVNLTAAGKTELDKLSQSIFSYLEQNSAAFEKEELETTLGVLEKLQDLIEK